VRNLVVTTVRATTKAERATVAGATRTTATMMTAMATAATAATMTPNVDKEKQGWHLPPSTTQGHNLQEQECRETRPAAD